MPKTQARVSYVRKVEEPSEPKDGTTETTTFNDGTFIRTAIVVLNEAKPDGETGSLDVVRIVGGKVERIAQINVSYLPHSDKGVSGRDEGKEECLIVDVIDVERRFTERRMLAFSQTERKIEKAPEGGRLVSVDFRRDV